MRIADKKRLRTELRAVRSGLALPARQDSDRKMHTVLFSLPEFRRSNTIFCYLGLVERGETDTEAIVDRLHSNGKTVVAPFVTSKGMDADSPPRMEARILERSTKCASSDWGLIEPQGTEAIDPREIDLAIIPSLGVALTGDRIGKGKGFYDRYLPQVSGPRICLCYEDCIVAPFGAEDHDIRMDVLITERRLVRIV